MADSLSSELAAMVASAVMQAQAPRMVDALMEAPEKSFTADVMLVCEDCKCHCIITSVMLVRAA